MPFRNARLRMALYLLAAAVGITIGLHGHYTAASTARDLALARDTIHTHEATIRGLRETNAVLRLSVWDNKGAIQTNTCTMDSLKGVLKTQKP